MDDIYMYIFCSWWLMRERKRERVESLTRRDLCVCSCQDTKRPERDLNDDGHQRTNDNGKQGKREKRKREKLRCLLVSCSFALTCCLRFVFSFFRTLILF